MNHSNANQIPRSQEGQEEGGGDEEKAKINTDAVELPPQPIVLVSTHNDLKKTGPGARVDPQAGSDLANGFGLPFIECNARGLGIQEAFEAAITSIVRCEDNMTFEKVVLFTAPHF